MLVFLSSILYANTVGVFPLRLLPKSTKKNPTQQEVQLYIQSTLQNLSDGKDLQVVTQDKFLKRIEGTQYYEQLLKTCKKSDCIKNASVAGQVPYIIGTVCMFFFGSL